MKTKFLLALIALAAVTFKSYSQLAFGVAPG